VGSLRDCTWILGLTEYRVAELERADDGRLVIDIERRGFGAMSVRSAGDERGASAM
jgi:hypothetical protein